MRNNLTKIANEFGGFTAVDEYLYSENSGALGAESYAKDNLISRYKIAGTNTRYVDYYYDELNRLVDKELNLNDNKVILSTYSYYNSDRGGKYTTTQLKSEALDNIKYTYYYDKVGNVTDIKLSTRSAPDTMSAYRSYEYDDKNQLTRENNNSSKETVVYTYDGLGNISTKTKYAYTTSDSLGTAKETITYNYGKDSNAGWNHILTSVDLDGDNTIAENEKIDYDAIGNPTTYLGAALTWNGRELTSYNIADDTETAENEALNVTYTYDSDGLRTSKDNNGEKSTYYYVSGQLRYETRGNLKFYYFYDASGNLSAIRYYPNGGTTFYMYYTLTNHQGDIIALYDANANLVASYEYDAWGNCTIVSDTSGRNIGELNPIRYRGYYYDSETKLYYLQSRYYDPQVGRFLNADGLVSTGQGVLGYNMFAYCGNNPVMRSDPTGHFWNEFCSALAQTFQQASGYFVVAAGVSQVDTPALGLADIVAGAMILGGALVCTGIAAYTVMTAPPPAISIPKAEEKVESKPLPPSTVIYRYGGANPGNLTPKEKDRYSGLSFSTKPMPGAAMTTIEAINATGVVYAIQDSPTHISVRPIGATMDDWINEGSSSVWTQAVKSVVIKWDVGN